MDQIVQHEKECKWRLILCPGDGSSCEALVPFCEVEDHVQECPDCEWPPFEYSAEGTILTNNYADDDGDHLVWATNTTEFDGKLFFCRKFMENGIFTVDVVMNGSLEECKEFLIEVALLDANSEEVTAVKTSFPPRPLKEDNEPEFCLTVPFKLMSKVCKFNAEDDVFDMEILLKVVKLE